MITRIVLGALLLVLGAMKLIEGHDPEYWIGKGLYLSVAWFECVLGAMLFTSLKLKLNAVGSLGALAIAATGMVIAFLRRAEHRSCGCFGSVVPDDWRLHLAICATIGLFALMTWEAHRKAVSLKLRKA